MRWGIAYLTVDIEVSCRHLMKFIDTCMCYKQLDMLTKIISECKCPLRKYIACQEFWDHKIKK